MIMMCKNTPSRKSRVVAVGVLIGLFISTQVLANNLSVTHPRSPDSSSSKPIISILATGGTIAGQNTSGDDNSLSYQSGSLSPEALIKAVPGLNHIAILHVEEIASIGSQDMNDEVWIKLARRIKELVSTGETQGIVVTHGTDTLEETAFFLSLILSQPEPVILTGAMRPSSAVSADGPGNLLEAVRVAASPSSDNRGVLVVMNDTIQSPVWTSKADTTSIATFQSPYSGPEGHVDSASVRYIHPAKPGALFQLNLPVSGHLPRVEIIYSHSNMDEKQITNAVRDGASGIILAGVGDGNASRIALEALKQAREQGIVVVRASRSWTGVVKRNVEVDDDKVGFVVSSGLNPAKARILTQLLLANKITEPGDIQNAFDRVTGTLSD